MGLQDERYDKWYKRRGRSISFNTLPMVELDDERYEGRRRSDSLIVIGTARRKVRQMIQRKRKKHIV